MDIIIGMPSVFRNMVVKPIPKGENKVTSLFENFRGIALVASVNKHLEVGSSHVSSKCQFCFTGLHSFFTMLCTGVFKATVSHYLCCGSNVCSCLIGASKEIDTVDHLLFLEN